MISIFPYQLLFKKRIMIGKSGPGLTRSASNGSIHKQDSPALFWNLFSTFSVSWFKMHWLKKFPLFGWFRLKLVSDYLVTFSIKWFFSSNLWFFKVLVKNIFELVKTCLHRLTFYLTYIIFWIYCYLSALSQNKRRGVSMFFYVPCSSDEFNWVTAVTAPAEKNLMEIPIGLGSAVDS